MCRQPPALRWRGGSPKEMNLAYRHRAGVQQNDREHPVGFIFPPQEVTEPFQVQSHANHGFGGCSDLG